MMAPTREASTQTVSRLQVPLLKHTATLTPFGADIIAVLSWETVQFSTEGEPYSITGGQEKTGLSAFVPAKVNELFFQYCLMML